jgi:glycosyltransferase involved in cell wall biosynthesis
LNGLKINKMQKLIVATDAWHPQVNGVVKCVEEIKEQLEKKGFEVVIIHPGMFFSVGLFFYPEIRLSVFPKSKIKKIIEKENPDFIHIVTEGPIGIATRSLCLKNKWKFTTANHTNFQVYIKKYLNINSDFFSNLVFAYLKKFHNAGSGIMVITPEIKENFEKQRFKNVRLWPLGVDVDLFKRNDNIPHEYSRFQKPVFIYFGRIAKEKNVEEFLKIDLPGTKLVVGAGPLKKALEQKYKNAIFTGCKKGQELVDLLSASDVFVFPSLTDTFPLAIIEALACGLPIAAHDIMNLDKLVTKDVGILSDDLKTAAIECLKIPKENCRRKALEFSWEKSINYFKNNLVKIKY